jgi:hypothetical protein
MEAYLSFRRPAVSIIATCWARVRKACPESSTLSSIRPEPFDSELRAELLMAEGRPKGVAEGKGG